jgi:hypothetical protein
MKSPFFRLRPLPLAMQAALAISVGQGLLMSAAQAQQRALQLAGLDGGNGFRLDGTGTGERGSIAPDAAGDINGDGFDDIVVGAHHASPNGVRSGSAFIVFGHGGSAAFPAAQSLSALNGSNGFRINGQDIFEYCGKGVSDGGDINGDGIDDVLIGCYGAPGGTVAGATYVLFGRAGAAAFGSVLNPASLNGSNGFRLMGEQTSDSSGAALAAAGDVNGDGLDDLIIGARYGNANGPDSGAAYVVFGRSGVGAFAPSIALSSLNGSNGFRVFITPGQRLGAGVSGAGDINGDGVDDVVIGTQNIDYSYVVFGRSGGGFPASLNGIMLDGSNGFRIAGMNLGEFTGRFVSRAGDINGDGVDDLIVGALSADANGADSGRSYVIFGRSAPAQFGEVLDTSALNGSNGFHIVGAAAGDQSGAPVSAAGDVNGDGVDDLVVGAPGGDSNGSASGSSYLLFGRSGVEFPSVIHLGTLPGSAGIRIDGVAANDAAAAAAGAGDVNGDGLNDLIIGAPGADPNSIVDAGSSYVVFGNAAPLRDGPSLLVLPPILEDGAATNGRRLRTLVAGLYLDTQPLAGVAIDQSPAAGNGVWQHALSGTALIDLPPSLSTTNALVIGAAATGPEEGRVGFSPSADFFGDSPALTLRLWDGAGRAPEATNIGFGSGHNIAPLIGSFGGFSDNNNLVSIVQPVLSVNDAPDFLATDPAPVRNDAGVVQVFEWASFTPGAANESDQFATQYQVSAISNPALFAAGFAPRVIAKGSSGTLQYAPASLEAAGSSSFTVRVRDSGGTANGGVEFSPPQTFTITITPSAPVIFGNEFE